MVTIPGILSPPAKRLGTKSDLFFDARIEADVQRTFDEIVDFILPLASVRTRRELERELGRRSQGYLRLKNELWHAILNALPPEDVMKFALEGYREISQLISEDTIVLGAEERELLLKLMDDLRDLLKAVADSWNAKQQTLTDVLLECSAPLQRVDMCVLSIFLVLVDEIKNWNMSSIKLLSHTAKDYMLEVEDIFLIYDDELAERLRTRGDTVSFHKVKRDIGLRS